MSAIERLTHGIQDMWNKTTAAGTACASWVVDKKNLVIQKITEIWNKVKLNFHPNQLDVNGQPASFTGRLWLKTIKPFWNKHTKYKSWKDVAVVTGGAALGAIGATVLIFALGPAAIAFGMVGSTGALCLGGYKANSQIKKRKNIRVCQRLDKIKEELISITTNRDTHARLYSQDPNQKKIRKIDDIILDSLHKIEKGRFSYIAKDYKEDYFEPKKQVEDFRKNMADFNKGRFYAKKHEIRGQLEHLKQRVVSTSSAYSSIEKIQQSFKQISITQDFSGLSTQLEKLSQQEANLKPAIDNINRLLKDFQANISSNFFNYKTEKKKLLNLISSFQLKLVSDWTIQQFNKKKPPQRPVAPFSDPSSQSQNNNTPQNNNNTQPSNTDNPPTDPSTITIDVNGASKNDGSNAENSVELVLE